MTEEVTIKIRTEVENSDLEQYRDSLSKTQKEAERTADSARKVGKQASESASELSKIGKDLGSISPTLGKITKNVTLLTKSFQQLGLNLKKLRFGRKGGNNGPLDMGDGNLNRNAGAGATAGRMGKIGKIGAVVGIASIGASLLGGLGGGAKLAGFDKLNAIGQPSIIDFLDPHLKKIRNLLGENGGLGEALSGLSMSNPVVKLVQLLSGNIGDTIGHWFDGAVQASTAMFNNIASSVSSIGNTIGHWFDGIDDAGIKVFNDILSMAVEILNTIRQWFNLPELSFKTNDSGDSNTTTPTTTPTVVPTPTPEPAKNPDPIPVEVVSNEPTDEQKDYVRKLYEELSSGNGKTSNSTSWLDEPAKMSNGLMNTFIMDSDKKLTGDNYYNTTNGGLLANYAQLVVEEVALGLSGAVSVVGNALGSAGKAIGDVFGGIGKAFGFAEGGVFMPNRPQLAVLGDNRTEPEAVAPYSLIVRAVGDALRESKTIGDAKTQPTTIEVPVSLNGKVIARAIYDDLDNERKRRNGVIV